MLNLVCGEDDFAASEAAMPQLLAATTLAQGARYEDFDSSNDKVAKCGLVALITGSAALKLVKVGLIAKLWGAIVAAVLALKKVLILVVLGAGALLRRRFARRKPEAPVAAMSVEPPLSVDDQPREGRG